MKLVVCSVLYEDLKLTPRYSEKIRGYLGEKYKDFSLLHNHDGDKFLYRYPKVQYKVIKNTPMIIGINEAADIVGNIGINDDEFILNDIKYDTFQKNILKEIKDFGIAEDYIEYEFITPWISLNQKNIRKYRESSMIEKEEILKNILIGNILSMCKGFNYTVNEKISCWINLKEIDIMLKGIKHIGFKGTFKTNFKIPQYFGIGKSVSRGFGTIKIV